MANSYKVKFYHQTDNWGIEYGHEIVDCMEEPDTNVSFIAYNLCECPEDATLNRDLFNGYDFLEAVKLGMRLAKLGYDEIEIEDIEE